MGNKTLNKAGKFAPKQVTAIALFEKALMSGKPFTAAEVLRKAGYSENSINQYSKTMKAIRPHINKMLERLKKHRDVVISNMQRRVGKADYAELVRGLDVLTKNIQLLEGRPTGIVSLDPKDRLRLDQLIDDEEEEDEDDE